MEDDNVQKDNISAATDTTNARDDAINNTNSAEVQQSAPTGVTQEDDYVVFNNKEEYRKYFENNYDFDVRKKIIDDYRGIGLTKTQIESLLTKRLNAEANERLKELEEHERLAKDPDYQQQVRAAKSIVEDYKNKHIERCKQRGVQCDEDYLNELDSLLTTKRGIDFIRNMNNITRSNENVSSSQNVDAHAAKTSDVNGSNFDYKIYSGGSNAPSVTIDNITDKSIPIKDRARFIVEHAFTPNGVNEVYVNKLIKKGYDINLGV